MEKFIPREKLGKKAKKALDRPKRTVWDFSPVTQKIDSKKIYNRKKTARARKDDFGMSSFLFVPASARHNCGSEVVVIPGQDAAKPL